MGIFSFLRPKETLVAVDIGHSGIKLVELDFDSGDTPILLNFAFAPFTENVFNNNLIEKKELVSVELTKLLEANEVVDKRVVTAVSGPSVFTKKGKMSKVPLSDLDASIRLEAGNLIPHNLDAVRVDYQVLGPSGKNQMDVMVVAAKNDVVDSYLDTFGLAGLEVAVVDIESFAVQNAFELAYPEWQDDVVALINIGARYTSINICQAGKSLITGDVSLGGLSVTEALADELDTTKKEAENIKKKPELAEDKEGTVREIMDRYVDQICGELNRQVTILYNATGQDEGLDRVVLTGGGSMLPAIVEDLAEKTGIEVVAFDASKGIEPGPDIDPNYVKDIGSQMVVAIGMAIRQPGDREIPSLEGEE